MAEAKIDVRINASDLEALRGLAERMERAAHVAGATLSPTMRPAMQPPQAEQTAGVEPENAYTSAAYWRSIADKRGDRTYRLETRLAELERACETKDRELADARTEIAKLKEEVDDQRSSLEAFDYAPTKKQLEDQITKASRLEIEKGHALNEVIRLQGLIENCRSAFSEERAAHNVTRESLKATTRKEAHLEQECEALKKVNDNALAELRRQRGVFERESAEHFATRIALRDTLRAAAERAREVADYAEEASETAYGKDVREIAATYDETRAALGLDTITLPPAAGETTKHTSRELGASKLRVREITPDASTAEEMARLFDEQVMGYAETKGEAAAPQPARKPFRAGDIVKHRRSGENWVLACDELDGYVMPAGWPDSVEPANGCDIVKPATDEERVAILKQAADSTGMRAARAKGQLEASAHEQPTPEPARRRRFRAGDHVRLPAQTTVYSAVLDENDAGSVAIEVSRNELNCISTSALTLIEPTHRARRNRELAFHFHRWSISTDADAMDSVPEFVRVAAEQLLRDPFGTEYGSVLADAGAKTGGAK